MQVTWQTTEPSFASQKRHAPGMVISRKDTIIIAVLINIALLAVLFATANQQESYVAEQVMLEVAPVIQEEPVMQQVEEKNLLPVDEIDQILQKYLERQEKDQEKENKKSERQVKKSASKKASEHIKVTVQEGDMLSKFAKKYGVTVADIIVLNELKSDALSIGQTLYIPKKTQTASKKKTIAVQKRQAVSKKTQNPLYYTVKKGDSPWTIARKFDLKVEEFLQMNGLNEAQARNLKVGQKIRIR